MQPRSISWESFSRQVFTSAEAAHSACRAAWRSFSSWVMRPGQLTSVIGRAGHGALEIPDGLKFADNPGPFLLLPSAGGGFKINAQFFQQPVSVLLDLLLGSDLDPAKIIEAADQAAFPEVPIKLDANGLAKVGDVLDRLSSCRFQHNLEIFSGIVQPDEFTHQGI
jgi:hypothetical protein